MQTTQWSTTDIIGHLRSTRLFTDLDDPSLVRFAESASICLIEAGDNLIIEGEEADAAYIVIAGRLSVVVTQPDGSRKRVNDVGPGEVIGEMGLITGDRRSATVAARRDSALIRIDAADFRTIVTDHPDALLTLTRTVVKRLDRSIHEDNPDSRRTVIAAMPAGERPAHHDFARDLAESLDGTVAVVSRRDAVMALGEDSDQGALAQYLHKIEDEHDYVILVGDGDDGQWVDTCRRQSDVSMYVGFASGLGGFGDYEPDRMAGERPSHMVFVQTCDLPSGTGSALRSRGNPRHHHVRKGSKSDVERVARIVTGTSVGVVFGGGGARGFAHLGVLKAMLEAAMPIDHVGGTSIGASVASGLAMGQGWERLVEMERWVTFERGRIVDATFPAVALAKGKRLVSGMREGYGETDIEDLWVDFFCVSTDLSVGEAHVHRRGPVWHAVRASTAVPGVFSPMRSSDGHVLVDGGVLDNLPVQSMDQEFSPATIVAIDLRAPTHLEAADLPEDGILSGWGIGARAVVPWMRSAAIPGLVESLIAASLVSGNSSGRTADVVLRPPVDSFGFMDFAAADDLIEVGYKHAIEYFDQHGVPQ